MPSKDANGNMGLGIKNMLSNLCYRFSNYRTPPTNTIQALQKMPEKEVRKVMACIVNNDFDGAKKIIEPYME